MLSFFTPSFSQPLTVITVAPDHEISRKELVGSEEICRLFLLYFIIKQLTFSFTTHMQLTFPWVYIPKFER